MSNSIRHAAQLAVVIGSLALTACGGNSGGNGPGDGGSQPGNGNPGNVLVVTPTSYPNAPGGFIAGQGQIGAMVSGKTYNLCHYSYVYWSNGWISLTVQPNGALDTGGLTVGFYSLDPAAANFNVISEVGGVTYCTLNFVAPNVLMYRVQYSGDGLYNTNGGFQVD